MADGLADAFGDFAGVGVGRAGGGEKVAYSSACGSTGTCMVIVPARAKLKFIVIVDPAVSGLLSPVSTTWGTGPVRSDRRLGR